MARLAVATLRRLRIAKGVGTTGLTDLEEEVPAKAIPTRSGQVQVLARAGAARNRLKQREPVIHVTARWRWCRTVVVAGLASDTSHPMPDAWCAGPCLRTPARTHPGWPTMRTSPVDPSQQFDRTPRGMVSNSGRCRVWLAHHTRCRI